MTIYPMICPGNGYILFRRDGCFIDGREDGQSGMMKQAASMRDAAKRQEVEDVARLVAPTEQWAVGHLVNHPPQGILPNVETTPIDVGPESLPEVLHALTSINFNFRRPCEGDHLLRTVVFRAKRDIEDEELWLDYKLESDEPPEWYVPVSESL